MDLFVGNLSSEVTPGELRKAVRRSGLPLLRANFAVEVVKARVRNGQPCRYGRITLNPERLAQRVMRRMNGQQLRGRRLVVREFHHRAASNERRALNWRVKPWQGPERRHAERRHHAGREASDRAATRATSPSIVKTG